VPDENDVVARGYDSFYAVWGRSPTLRRIWREHVTGPDYPAEFAHISFLPLAQLRVPAEGLHLAGGQVLVDLACGAGGPGLWVAKQSGARLAGRDLSPVAALRATERAAALGMKGRAEFGQGSFERTGIADQSADAAMTVDALQYAPDKAKRWPRRPGSFAAAGGSRWRHSSWTPAASPGFRSGPILSGITGRCSNGRGSAS
jgi:hypothetical protein